MQTSMNAKKNLKNVEKMYSKFLTQSQIKYLKLKYYQFANSFCF